MDMNDPTALAVGNAGGTGAGPGAGLYSMAGLSLSHDSVFSPDTSTPAEMGQIIHPVPVMTGISITNSLFKNELFNRVRARRAGEEDSEDDDEEVEEEDDEDPGLPRSPCSHTPPNAGEQSADSGTLLLIPCGGGGGGGDGGVRGGVIGSDGRSPSALGAHMGQHPLTGSIASILQHSSPGNKAKARSTCSAGSLSSMLSSETDEDSLSAGAANSPSSSAATGGASGRADKGGQMSHNAARHKIAIKPKKNHSRRRPVRVTPTEPSLPATPEERITPSSATLTSLAPSDQDENGGENNNNGTTLGIPNSSSAAELLDTEMSAGSASAVSSRPMSSTDEEVSMLAQIRSVTPISRKSSPLPELLSTTTTAASAAGVTITTTSTTATTMAATAGTATTTIACNTSAATTPMSPCGGSGAATVVSGGGFDAGRGRDAQQADIHKRRSMTTGGAGVGGVDETPEPVMFAGLTSTTGSTSSATVAAAAADSADSTLQSSVVLLRHETSPRRRPAGGVAMINIQPIQGGAASSCTSRSLASPVQRSKSMKTESVDGFRTGQDRQFVELSPSGGAHRALRPVSQVGSSELRPDFFDTRDSKTPLSAQNSPVKRGLNVSSDFFQRSKSFSAKVSETHQALEGKNGKELNSPNKLEEVVTDVRDNNNIKSLERRKHAATSSTAPYSRGSGSSNSSGGTSGVTPSGVAVAHSGGGGGGSNNNNNNVTLTPVSSGGDRTTSSLVHAIHASGVTLPALSSSSSSSSTTSTSTSNAVSATSDDPARDQGIRRRGDIDDERNGVRPTMLANGGSGAKIGSTGASVPIERPRSELLDGVELRRPRGGQMRLLSPDSDTYGSGQPNLYQQQQQQQQQQQSTTPTIASSIAGEPELFKVFARRSLKQKPGPHDEKQDTGTEKKDRDKVVPRAGGGHQQNNKEREAMTAARESKAIGGGGIHRPPPGAHPDPAASSPPKGVTPTIRSASETKRLSESQLSGQLNAESPTTTTTAAPCGGSNLPNVTTVELLASKKDLSKVKTGANVPSSAKGGKELIGSAAAAAATTTTITSTTPPSLTAENIGPTSLPALRREVELRKQQSLAHPPATSSTGMGHASESFGGGAVQGGPRSLHGSAVTTTTTTTASAAAAAPTTTGGQTVGEKRASAVLLQRASSVAVRPTEANEIQRADDADPVPRSGTGGGTGAVTTADHATGQPEWLRLAQKKREKRELKEKMDNSHKKTDTVAANNAANLQDSTTATNNKANTAATAAAAATNNNAVSNQQEASTAKSSAGLRSSKVLDLVSNFQKLQMA